MYGTAMWVSACADSHLNGQPLDIETTVTVVLQLP